MFVDICDHTIRSASEATFYEANTPFSNTEKWCQVHIFDVNIYIFDFQPFWYHKGVLTHSALISYAVTVKFHNYANSDGMEPIPPIRRPVTINTM